MLCRFLDLSSASFSSFNLDVLFFTITPSSVPVKTAIIDFENTFATPAQRSLIS
jgi:hypothetical protein